MCGFQGSQLAQENLSSPLKASFFTIRHCGWGMNAVCVKFNKVQKSEFILKWWWEILRMTDVVARCLCSPAPCGAGPSSHRKAASNVRVMLHRFFGTGFGAGNFGKNQTWLRYQRALVTGGLRGLGLRVAKWLADTGRSHHSPWSLCFVSFSFIC